MTRSIWFLLGLVLAAGPVAAQAPALDPKVVGPRQDGDDMVMGLANAPTTIILYTSLTCPPCAQFEENTFPQLKTYFIDTGLVKFIYRDFPLDQLSQAAAMLAHCAGPGRYFMFMDTFFHLQADWVHAVRPLAELETIARLGGLSDSAIDACLRDKALQGAIEAKTEKSMRDFGVSATPTFIINGQKHTGTLDYAQFIKLLPPRR